MVSDLPSRLVMVCILPTGSVTSNITRIPWPSSFSPFAEPSAHYPRHARACPGHPRLSARWIAGSSPAMTVGGLHESSVGNTTLVEGVFGRYRPEGAHG